MLERATDDMLLELQQADLHMESYLAALSIKTWDNI